MKSLGLIVVPVTLLLVLACAGGPDPADPTQPTLATPVAASSEMPLAPAQWPSTDSGSKTQLAVGPAEGVFAATPVTFVYADEGVAEPSIVGMGLVTGAQSGQSDVQVVKLAEGLTPDGLNARLWQPSDAAAIAGLPDFKRQKKGGLPHYAGPLPDKLRHKNPNKRLDAMAKYEGDPSATPMIIYMMVKDPSFDVRKKAWRMIRARWKRGVGKASHNRAAALWMSTRGPQVLRGEATQALADHR